MKLVDSQLLKPPFPTFSQFISAHNHELKTSSYEEEKSIDHNNGFIKIKGGRGRGLRHGRGGVPRFKV